MIECTVCSTEIHGESGAEIGELLDCFYCGCELEIVGVNPARVREVSILKERRLAEASFSPVLL